MSIFLSLSQAAGGLALFLFGMNMMSEGLRLAAGQGLRKLLVEATRRKTGGVLLGTVAGTFAQSSPVTVMLLGFVNAGLISSIQAFPVTMGANIGTTLSMQAAAFRVGDFCFATIALGFALRMLGGDSRGGRLGGALLGFGLLFLGIQLIGSGVAPFKDRMIPLLAHIDGATARGLLQGTAAAFALTLVIQSSGALIATCYALIHSGVFTDLGQLYPVILGAHMGTCVTAWIASPGCRADAVRVAAGHQVFNMFNAALGAAVMPWMVPAMKALTPDLVRQTANLHTTLMLLAALILLPVSSRFARLAGRIIPRRDGEDASPSHLDPDLLPRPEAALHAATMELNRILGFCQSSLDLDTQVLLRPTRSLTRRIHRNEEIVDEIKPAMLHYLHQLTRWKLSRRQAVCAQVLAQGVVDIERVMDHLERFCDLCADQHHNRHALFGASVLHHFQALYGRVRVLFQETRTLFARGGLEFHQAPVATAAAFEECQARLAQDRAFFMEQTEHYRITPLAGLYYSELIYCLERLVRHLYVLVSRLGSAEFRLDPALFSEKVPLAPSGEMPMRETAKSFYKGH